MIFVCLASIEYKQGKVRRGNYELFPKHGFDHNIGN